MGHWHESEEAAPVHRPPAWWAEWELGPPHWSPLRGMTSELHSAAWTLRYLTSRFKISFLSLRSRELESGRDKT